ncbi:GH36-type glycosyl hydrolase domain-containing protein [Hydrogenophaga sp.]|uniref:GH36-type glycosyl hydrolase domain-containing protein n=1 Tax=Hydrogenophaga sp. TaxID=1904254 RepID=UPI003F710264
MALRRLADWIPQPLQRVLDAGQGPALEPIRSEIFGIARFEQHGRSLGATHRARRAPFGQATFYPRLRSNIRSLRAAYRHITDHAQDEHDLSPAAEWLFDNFHLIEDQLREIREGLPDRYYRSLPVLQDAPLTGLPRVYGIAWAFVAHTDGAFDDTLLAHFLNAYQDTRELTQGELWALPTTLRVVLVENLRRLADRIASQKAARELASLCASRADQLSLEDAQGMRALAARRGMERVFVVHLAQHLAGPRPARAGSELPRIRQWLHELAPDLVALQTQYHADQAADHLSMGNAVTALRLIGAADWSEIVARTSRVVRVMLASPVFEAEDDATRNKTLHGIERLSVRCGRAESAVARALLRAMHGGTGPSALAGHWLDGEGRAAFDRELGVKRLLPPGWRPVWPLARAPLYFGALLLGTLGLVTGLWLRSGGVPVGWGGHTIATLAVLLMLFPASEAVVALVNRLISESAQPVHLPRFLMAEGLPPTARTLVVVPALLTHVNAIAPLVHRLHLHHLANPEPFAQFALLSDWADADTPERPEDGALLRHAQDLIEALNARHPAAPGEAPRFLLLHRVRSHSATQDRWLGWERKRGKIEQLVAALATGTQGPFLDLGEVSRMAAHTRHVLTLDSDTQLPPGRLRALVGVAEHPENRPVLDASGQRVVQGYGILQPRVVAPLPGDAVPTPHQWLRGGQHGLDPYSAMTSDVYQDVFNEGSFTGKGLLHVATLHAVLGQRLPAECVLSHDLIEGALARCAVVTDVTLIEAEPVHADVAAARLHRWTRGDWQLLPFLLRPRRWPLSAINRWKLVDNLRRSLVAPASLALVVLALFGYGLSLPMALLLSAAAQAAAPLMGAFAGSVPRRFSHVGERFLRGAFADLARAILGGLWHLALLPQQAQLTADAALRTLHRLLVSRRHLLEWTTADAARAAHDHGPLASLRRHGAASALALALLAVLCLLGPQPPALAVVVLVVWGFGPFLSWWANTPWPWRRRQSLSAGDRELLDGVARDTWRLFERCVDAQNHCLPPDNLQTVPFDAVAHRTSPTNIGLYLLSVACARQFGWIGTQDLLARLEATLASLQQMERHRGHFLNWYDTQTLQPLLPRYVSTVDSGNLCAELLAVAQACTELAREPHAPQATQQAIERSLARIAPRMALVQSLLHRPVKHTAIGHLLRLPLPDPHNAAAFARFLALLQDAGTELQGLGATHAAGAQPVSGRDEMPWLLADHLATLRSAALDRAAAAEGTGERATQRLRALAATFEQLAWEADFRFLYHPKRHLLHIGFRLEEQQLDTSFYDLLASESRTTSLLAIAKGDLPVKHWSALGRPFFASGPHAVLRSWSGSMFEYLMPTLLSAEPHGSVLQEAACSALHEQMAFVRRQGIPWGISESAHAGRDHTLAYQYAPQGVPRLALRRTPLAERVIAPYATVLASQINARLACQNLRALTALGARGRYGFVEALDYTPARQTEGGAYTLVSTCMAHHQGMSIVALANVLLGGLAQRWGMAHPRIEAVSSLLHEAAPRVLPRLPQLAPPRLPLQSLQRRAPDHVRTVVPGAQALEPTHLMSNGRYSVTLRAHGGGWSRWGGTGITRWRDDALRDDCGGFVYLRLGQKGAPVSLTSHPAPDPNASYQSIFHTDRVCFEASWPELRTTTTVWVSPEDDIELRKVVLVNRSDRAIELELISALDVTLASPAADEAHPAFSSFFVKAHWLADQQALRFERTPRLHTERTLQAAHFVAATEGQVLGLNCQTDRQHWLGRNHTPAQPLATLQAAPTLSGPLDTGLDPVAVLGVVLRLAPGAQASVTFATAASDDAATLLAIVDKYRQPSSVERASVMSATLAGVQAVSHRPKPDHLPALQALTTALVLTCPKVDLPAGDGAGLPPRVCDRRTLWPLGISGDRPLLLVDAGSPQGMGLLRILAQALREWSRCGVACDVVVLSNEVHSYQMPLQRELALLCEQQAADARGRPGPALTGLHVLRPDALSPAQLATLEALARARLQADGQPLLHQARAWVLRHDTLAAHGDRAGRLESVGTRQLERRAAVPVGVFEAGGRAFAFEVGTGLRPRRPWVNVLANAGFGTLVSESGAGNTWALNSRLNQLTAWSNDPVGDPPGEWFLLQDRRTREVWSVAPSAWGDDGANYRVVHGQGHTTIEHRRGDVAVSVRWCVDADTAVQQVRIRLTNHGASKAHLRAVALVEWMQGEKRGDRATLETAPCFATPLGEGLVGLLSTQTEAAAGFGGGTAFLAEAQVGVVDSEGLDWTCDRREFFDTHGQLVLPEHLGQRSGFGLDPCAALSRPLTLRPGASLEQVFLIGYADSPAAARDLALQAITTAPPAREQATLARWDALLGATQVRTPDPLFDAMVNRWLLYQTVSSRLWAKAGFYQAGGATGYRDQLQDTMALVWAAPQLLREQIVLCASRQFAEGDVQHWWHAPGGAGVRTRFSDDLLWLPWACSHYLRATGDAAVLDAPAPFLEGSTLADGAEDAYDTPRVSATSATVYEHAARTIDHSLRTGAHGLPLMGGGDWNDGMNRVGIEGRGESVWLAWFLCAIATDWIPLARQRGDEARALRWEAALQGWGRALTGPAWDGAWFKRAFFDDGSALGSHAQPEARIDLIAQAWSVLSGQAPAAMQRQAMEAVEACLVDTDAGLLQLLTPPLAQAVPSAGYIQAYPPGVRENGGQYSHAGVWALMAAAALAVRQPEGTPARDTPYRYFTYLSPAHRAAHPAWGPVYGVEPYAMAADVYSQPPYVGRGGWSWYTGAAGWLHRAAVESLLGLRMGADELCFTPCLPSHWPRAEITLVRDGRSMRFVLVRGDPTAALAEAGATAGARLLAVGERLRWGELPAHSGFVVPLPAGG